MRRSSHTYRLFPLRITDSIGCVRYPDRMSSFERKGMYSLWMASCSAMLAVEMAMGCQGSPASMRYLWNMTAAVRYA